MRFSAFSAYRENSVDCKKIQEFQFEDPSTIEQMSNNTLMEDVKPLAVEK